MSDSEQKSPAAKGDKAGARRARQAEALRRNLARRKAQARGRADDGTSRQTPDEEPPAN